MNQKNDRRKRKGKTDYRQYCFSGKEWVECWLEIMGIAVIVNYLCYRSWWAFVGILPGSFWYIKWKKKRKGEKRRQNLCYHFRDVLQGLLTAIRAGYSMEHAVQECRKELEQMYGKEEDLVKELVYMEHQLQVGVPVEKLFMDLGKRSGVEDILNFGEIFVIARRSGGNLGEIMEQMARVLGEKIRVQREIEVCISGKRMEQMIMSLVPGGMILYIQLTSQGFMDVLYHNVFGILVMTGCLILYLFSFWMGRKIVRISI